MKTPSLTIDGAGKLFVPPSGIAVDSTGNIYVPDIYNNPIRKLTPIGTNWVVTTLGGMADIYGTADGTGSTARFSNPNGVAVDSVGNIYVADFYFNTIRKGYPPPMFRNSEINLGQFRSVLTGPPGSVGGRGSFERSVKLAAHLDQHLCGSSEFQ